MFRCRIQEVNMNDNHKQCSKWPPLASIQAWILFTLFLNTIDLTNGSSCITRICIFWQKVFLLLSGIESRVLVWTDLVRVEGYEDTWKWNTTGVSLSWSNWGWNQPDNLSPGEDCVAVACDGICESKWAWDDYACGSSSTLAMIVCQE